MAALCCSVAAILLLAHYSPVISRHVDHEAARHREINGVYMRTGGYIDAGDYVLVGQLSSADHSRGGVFFIGDSQSQTALMPWLLSPEQQRVIKNYSIGGLGHRDLRSYIRSLVEDYGLLEAGGENVTIFLGISHHMMEEKNYDKCYYVCSLFKRHGLHTYDGNEGIRRVPMTAIEQFVRLQRIHANRFLRIAIMSPTSVKPVARGEQSPDTGIFPEPWRGQMEAEVQELAELLDYLRQRNVRVRAILRASGSWIAAGPYAGAYREMIEPLLASRGAPLIDQTGALPDEEMGDFVHPRYTGQLRIHALDTKLATGALAEMGMTIDATKSLSP